MDSRKEEEEEACLVALMFASSFLVPRAIQVAVDLNLFGIIAEAGPGAHLSASEIACQLPTENPLASSMLERMLRLFASHSLLSHSLRSPDTGGCEHLYGLTPASRFFLVAKEDGNFTSLINLTSQPVYADIWSHLKEAILGDVDLFNMWNGMSLYEYMDKDPVFNNIFNRAMNDLSSVILNEILVKYKGFEGVRRLVDVGGGTGKTLDKIISKYPSIEGINYDLPHVIRSAQNYPGIEHVGGEMFTSIPKGDAIILKNICHNWDDEKVIKLMLNIYEALPKGGKLILITEILPEVPDTSKASQYASRLDIIMFAFPGGKERTLKEYEALTVAAGFSKFRLACIIHGHSAVIESYK